jgi:hypothetical protein
MSLSRVDQDNLWLSIGQTEAGQFWEVGDKLLNEPLKSVAFRFFSTGSESFVQRQIRPVNEDGSAKTLGQALDELGYKTKLPKIQGILVPLETVENFVLVGLVFFLNRTKFGSLFLMFK